tara:strand:- start:1336 stop:1680 length:345 start_codon:yes stop_codon:yes gene_type:complete
MPNTSIKNRVRRIRNKLRKVNKERFRLSVFRSARNISAQIIDDKNSKTIVSASSIKDKNSKRKKADLSLLVAETLAKKAIEKKITKIYFDRGKYRYHGRIKIFAETLRKNGLTF